MLASAGSSSIQDRPESDVFCFFDTSLGADLCSPGRGSTFVVSKRSDRLGPAPAGYGQLPTARDACMNERRSFKLSCREKKGA